MCEVCDFIKSLNDKENLNKSADIIQDVIFADDTEYMFSERYRKRVIRLILQFGFERVFEAAKLMLFQYSDTSKRLEKLPGTVYNISFRAGDVKHG